MQTKNTETYDLIVVGGGPGGSTIASFVAMQGHRVLLLERERFPRYQIGESLLPATVHGICQMLGVWDRLEQAGFVRKNGAAFRWGTSSEPWIFAFNQAKMLEDIGANYAYQVERAKFDAILLDNARLKGVEVREQHRVDDLIVEGERVVGVRFTDGEGRRGELRATYVADASGNASALYRHVGQRVFSKFFRNLAMFCYFEGGDRLPPPNQGNILCEAFSEGWLWYIPLNMTNPTLTSVGAVIANEHAERIQSGDQDAIMREFIAQCPRIRGLLANARRVTEGMYGKFRVRKDWSYTNERFWKPGIVLVGDVACFIDPVLSTGVHLTTYSALLAARSINSCLRGHIDEASSFEEFERRYRFEFETFYNYLIAFYDMHQDAESYFWAARKVLSSKEMANEAFVRLVAGGVTAPEIYMQAKRGAGERMQKYADQLQQHASPEDRIDISHSMAKGVQPSEPAAEAPKPAYGGIEDIRRLSWGATSPADGFGALFEGALAPSHDGYHWVRP